MKIDILTLFPGMFKGPLTESLIAKAREKGIISIMVHDIRSFTKDRHRTADDKPFGGGPGMVMKIEPVHGALKKLGCTGKKGKKPLVIYLSPQGKPFDQQKAKDLSKKKHIVLLCGHYEGIDERIMKWVDLELSIGDYVLTGGEIPAMAVVDAVSRMIPGVVKEAGSVENDSFYGGLLDCPHYTRPAVFEGMKVPEVLLSGHHKKIEEWKKAQVLARTSKRRPDLISRKKKA
ncbi:MAG: tRNA (guanosine(37)-N1)-methyltransferase TrmD [Endomicrobiales bacterium]|nr:tRNA (guanosine(37)-N1)-methyltransferase TrmD [Endomicrobiales bacterium]